MRLLGTASLTLAVPLALALLGLSACDDDADRAAVDRVVAAADDARGGVLHRIAQALALGDADGSRSFTVCGDALAPGGVVLNDVVRFDSAGALTEQEAASAAAGLLEDDGWQVRRPGDPRIVSATKGDLTMRLEITPAQLQVDLGSGCIETSREVAEEYDDRPRIELGRSP